MVLLVTFLAFYKTANLLKKLGSHHIIYCLTRKKLIFSALENLFIFDQLVSHLFLLILKSNKFFKILGIKIKDEKDALECIKMLHGRGPSTVVISSSALLRKDKLVGYGSKASSMSFFYNIILSFSIYFNFAVYI